MFTCWHCWRARGTNMLKRPRIQEAIFLIILDLAVFPVCHTAASDVGRAMGLF